METAALHIIMKVIGQDLYVVPYNLVILLSLASFLSPY